MSYGRIRRGPMAGDAFTQIRNTVFRDLRLSAKAMGIFGNISTHRDGWGITPESISTQMRDGVNAIKAGLRELEQFGYLQRERERRPDGTLGASTYFITDQPDAVGISGKNSRSEPADDFPPVEKPTVDQPTVDDRPHKKTIPLGKKISFEKTTTSSPAEVSPDVSAVVADVEDGGGGGSLDESRSTAEHIAASLDYRGKPPDKRLRQTIVDRLTAALEAGWTVDGLALYLDLGDAPVRSAAAVYAARLAPDRIPDPEPLPAVQARPGGIRGPLPSAEEIAGLTLDDVFGTGQPAAPGGMWEEASARARKRLAGASVGGGTDDRVAGWGQIARQLAPGGHKPYSDSVWHVPADPAAAAIPHCGSFDCDPVSRLRDAQDEKGFAYVAKCPECHPSTWP